MYRVLQIHETVEEISDHTTPYTNRDLLNLMLVSKVFSVAVIDQLWEHQLALLPLFKILPLEMDGNEKLVGACQWCKIISVSLTLDRSGQKHPLNCTGRDSTNTHRACFG